MVDPLDSGSDSWLYIRITWGVFKAYQCPSPGKGILTSGGEDQAECFLKAAQVILLWVKVESYCVKEWEDVRFSKHLHSSLFLPVLWQ